MKRQELGTSGYGDIDYVEHVLRYYHIGVNGSMVEIALSQVGNRGGETYWRWYGYTQRVEWCAVFLSWVANEAGMLETGEFPKFAGVKDGIEWFKQNNQWQNKNYTPKAGDIIFFDWEQDGISDHVGIVEKVEGNAIYTIEGNSVNDECQQRNYTINSIFVFGYGIF